MIHTEIILFCKLSQKSVSPYYNNNNDGNIDDNNCHDSIDSNEMIDTNIVHVVDKERPMKRRPSILVNTNQSKQVRQCPLEV